jgi:hypothetical protein
MENSKISWRGILTLAVFTLILGGFFLLNRGITPPEISQSERRPLATLPELSLSSLLSAEFMDAFEDFAADSFVFRDGFRTARARMVFDVFRQSDKSGLYYGASGAGKFEKLDEASARQVAGKIRKLSENLGELKLYYALVPDKSVYAGRWLPGFDPERARRVFQEELREVAGIDLAGALTAADFYRTDLHWDQSKLDGVLAALAGAMGFEDRLDSAFSEQRLGEFQGVYTGQLALPLEPDVLTYRTNGVLAEATVRYLNPRSGQLEEGPMYDSEAFGGRDPYDLFLSGAQPLIVMDNPAAETERELYIFRDSFSSSLAPLLISAYARITLIDLRYIDSRVLPQYVTFAPGADVLFLYSSQIVNNATTLLVN